MAARSVKTGKATSGVAKTRAAPVNGQRGAGSPKVYGKRVVFDAETWNALDLLAHESMKDFQELADEAFRDLLRKHGRPTDLKTALKRSAEKAAKSVK